MPCISPGDPGDVCSCPTTQKTQRKLGSEFKPCQGIPIRVGILSSSRSLGLSPSRNAARARVTPRVYLKAASLHRSSSREPRRSWVPATFTAPLSPAPPLAAGLQGSRLESKVLVAPGTQARESHCQARESHRRARESHSQARESHRQQGAAREEKLRQPEGACLP